MSLKSNWKSYRYHLERWGCLQVAGLLPRLSLRSCNALAQVLGALFYWFDHRSRHIADENLRLVFGERLPPRLRRQVALLSFQNFARTMIGLFWSAHLSGERILACIRPTGFERALEMAKAQNKGLIFACAHFGNWEFAPMALQVHNLPLQIVAENFKNALLDEIFARARGRNFHEMIRQEKSFLKLVKRALRRESSALLADLTVPPSQAAVRIQAFRQNGQPLEMSCSRLPAVVAMRGKALIVPVLTYPDQGLRHEIRALHPLDASEFCSEEQISQHLWNLVETAIVENPQLWLWSYKHFRYKPAGTNREYPDYARVHPEFDLLQPAENQA